MNTRFADHGYVSPVPILSATEAHRLYKALVEEGRRVAPMDWTKGWATASRLCYSAAVQPKIVSILSDLLGPDVLLWGCRLVTVQAGARHAWHSDLESASPDAHTISVWLALKDCAKESSLSVMTGSHKIGRTVQEVRASNHCAYAEETNEDVTDWARQFIPESAVEIAECKDGEALFFDGRLWHGSNNTTQVARSALLLQYATPDTPIRIPSTHQWPFTKLDHPLPPCVMIKGKDTHRVNSMTIPPVAPVTPSVPQLTTQARQIDMPTLAEGNAWNYSTVFSGRTAGLKFLSCHVSVLQCGQSPHAPHRHAEEEILMVLNGEADILLPDLDGEQQRQRLRARECVYYPAQFAHTLEGVSTEPVTYLMLKWIADPVGSETGMSFRRWLLEKAGNIDEKHGFNYNILQTGQTDWLTKLQCHTTAMLPGAGYEPHVDSYDVVMITLDGNLESIGQNLSPKGVYFYAAGEPHGARNPGPDIAHYAVFEFHTQPLLFSDNQQSPSFFKKVTEPRRWYRHFLYRGRKLRQWLTSIFRT